MPTATLKAGNSLHCQMAAEAVDTAEGVIRGCTVAKSGVRAVGKFMFLDAKGLVTWDEELAVKKYPVFTDAKTLDTLMTAASVAGKRLKVREDHVDEVGARAGYADTFKLTDDGRVTADIHLFKSYRNRDVVLETSSHTPESIGLSIDYTPFFDLVDGHAMMRVRELHAVDIVDEGAITPEGLLLNAGVDSERKLVNPPIQPPEKMAATLDDIMTQLTEMKAGQAALAKTVGELQAKSAASPTADPKVEEALKAANEAKSQLSAVNASLAQMKKEKALLGFRGTATELAAISTASAEDIEKLSASKKDYLTLVADRVAAEKCTKTAAHIWVMKNHRSEYAAHLAAKGVIRADMAA